MITLDLPVKEGENLGSGFGLGNRYPDLAAAGTSLPLQGTSVSTNSPEMLKKDACDEPLLPGEPAPPCTPPVHGLRELARLSVDNRRPSNVLVWASAGIQNTGTPGAKATVHYAIFLDGRAIAERSTTLDGAQRERVPIEALVKMRAGRHMVGFEALGASFSSREAGEEIVAPVLLVLLTNP